MSQYRDDDIAIYENRMVRTLLDGAAEWLRQLESILQELQAADKERLDLEGRSAYFLRFQRLADWLDPSAAQHQKSVQDRSEMVSELLRELRSLQGSQLFAGTDGSTPVDALHITNLLANDGRYRKMVFLWDVWQRQLAIGRDEGGDETETATERMADLKDYSRLATIRALEALDVIDRGTGTSRLPDIEVDVAPASDGAGHRVTLQHCSGAIQIVNIDVVGVSLGASYEPFEDPLPLHRALERIDAAAREHHELCCLLHPTLPSLIEPSERGRVRTFGADGTSLLPSAWTRFEGLIVLPIHPLAVDGVEMLGRFYRLMIEVLRARCYPFRSPITGELAEIPDRAIDVNGTGLVVRNRHLVLMAPAIDRQPLQPTRRKGANVAARPQDEVDWDIVLAPLEAMRRAALRCPVFPVEHHNLPTRVDFWDESGYRARCTSCAAVWGVRVCANCGGTYPFMHFDSDAVWMEAASTGVETEYFGMDLTSQSCSRDRQTFVCPSCWHCERRRAGDGCDRCRQVAAP